MRPDRLNESAVSLINLSEWEHTGPEQNAQLNGLSFEGSPQARRLTDNLKGRVDIREGYRGIEITTSSFVGRVDVGPLRISVQPKIPAIPLTTLLRYAYSLRDISTIDETASSAVRGGYQELLIALLAAEVEELVHRGLARRYVLNTDRLESPRGRVLMTEIARRGGITEARLPCSHFDRSIDWHLNQVLLAGLEMAAGMAQDRDLRRRLYSLGQHLAGIPANEQRRMLRREDLSRAEHGITRLTASYTPALTILRLLYEMLGFDFGTAEVNTRMPGFLFDMNLFFQRLLSRFLHDNAEEMVLDESPIPNFFAYAAEANPKKRSAPAPRPDFALCNGRKLITFLDAKYKDVWRLSLPAEWLYQLSVYALASPNRTSVLLYATLAGDARDQVIEIRQPARWSSEGPARVIVRPVNLQRLAELVDPRSYRETSAERRRLAQYFVSLPV